MLPPYLRKRNTSSSAFPSYISGVHHFSVYFFAYMTVFNTLIEVVAFRLRGWCMLGVFLLPAFTCLRHECQDLLNPCGGMHVCTDLTSVYTLIRNSLGEMEVRAHVNSNGIVPSTRKYSSEEDRTHDAASSGTASPTLYQRAIPAPKRNTRELL